MEGYSSPKSCRSQNDADYYAREVGATSPLSLSSPVSSTSSGSSNSNSSLSPTTMRNVSIQLPDGHSPSAHRRAKYVHASRRLPPNSHHPKIPDLLDDAAASHDNDDDAPSLTSCSLGSYGTTAAMSVESLRRERSGRLMDTTFDDDVSDDDDDDADADALEAEAAESRRLRAVEWQSNSLFAAAAVARSGSTATAATSGSSSSRRPQLEEEAAGRMLLRSDTMDVVESTYGSSAITSECHLPDEAAFARQYLSTLFCGMGEVMGCGGGGSSGH
mmetsp:Transcript_23696/g.51336  ORF Transcript_23696/g.51336 Transcript_23696/m.51336 type:complete len:274 (-) Transcript_23696:310-1131(-)